MGGQARFVVYSHSRDQADSAAEKAFARLAQLEDIMSDYRKDSEINRLVSQPAGSLIKVSPDLDRVLAQAQRISERTQGAFDVTAGPLVELWRAARNTQQLPDSKKLEEARKRVSWQRIHRNGRGSVKIMASNLKIDLGGIAKGDAADQALLVFKRHGLPRAMIEMGGDIVCGEPPPNTNGWTLSIRNSDRKVTLKNQAISTSGDAEQFVQIGTTRYSHIVDPRTGYGVVGPRQVSVIAKTGLMADPLATALVVSGPKATPWLSQWMSFEAIFVHKD
jgi:thiamine biosynthesis lipoprotein